MSQSIIKSVTDLECCLETSDNSYQGQIIFACAHSMTQPLIDETLLQFKKKAPAVKVKVLMGHTGIVVDWIKQGRVEFGLILDNNDLSGLDYDILYSGTFNIYRSIERASSFPKECIFPEPRSEIFTVKNAYFSRYGEELKTQLEVNSWEVIARLVQQDYGYGFFPDYLTLSPERKRLLKACDINIPPIPYKLMTALPKAENLSRNGKLFIRLLRNYISELTSMPQKPPSSPENGQTFSTKKSEDCPKSPDCMIDKKLYEWRTQG